MKQYNNKTMNRRGFTLIELLVAVTILMVLTLFVANFYVDISKIYLGSLSSRSAQQNTRIALETISRYAKQARIAKWDNANQSLYLSVKDDSNTTYNITIQRTIVTDSYNRTHGALVMSMNPGGISNRLLTSEDLDISGFTVTYSPGIPAVLNMEIRASVEEGELTGKSWEKGAHGGGEVIMRTSVSLKGQYY